MRHALYIVGVPGAGKSTLVEELTRGHLAIDSRQPLAHRVYLDAGVVELGARRDNGFSGTDALAMNAITAAEKLVTMPDVLMEGLLLAEGDRLACDRFFEALLAGGWELVVAHLATPPGTAARRREQRGSTQNEAWLRGRSTKVARLVERWDSRVMRLDGLASPRHIAADLAHANPVARALMEVGT